MEKNLAGWWYAEGDSWVTGWKQIGGKWHHFDSRGYMEHDKTIDGYYLDGNGAWDFENCRSLKSIDIPNTVKSIGWGAFRKCANLITVNISAGTRMGGYVFDMTPYGESKKVN